MPVFYELRGKSAVFGDLGHSTSLRGAATFGCRYCIDAAVAPHDVGAMDDRRKGGAENILSATCAQREKNGGRPARDPAGPRRRPLSIGRGRPADAEGEFFIMEQYRLCVQVATLCGMRSPADFEIFARNRWRYGTEILFRSETLRKEWEPGAASIAEQIQAVLAAHAAGISTWVKIHPAAYPAELMEVIEWLWPDVDAWKIGGPPPGEPPPKAIVGRRAGFVDADTALAYLSPDGRARLERYAASHGRHEDVGARRKRCRETWRTGERGWMNQPRPAGTGPDAAWAVLTHGRKPTLNPRRRCDYLAATIAATSPCIDTLGRASAAGSWPNWRSTPDVMGLMLAKRLRRKASPNKATSERAIEELVTVTQSMRPSAIAARTSARGWATSQVEYTTICSTVAPAATSRSGKTCRPRSVRARRRRRPATPWLKSASASDSARNSVGARSARR